MSQCPFSRTTGNRKRLLFIAAKPLKACSSPIDNTEVDPETLMPPNAGYKVAFTIECEWLGFFSLSSMAVLIKLYILMFVQLVVFETTRVLRTEQSIHTTVHPLVCFRETLSAFLTTISLVYLQTICQLQMASTQEH